MADRKTWVSYDGISKTNPDGETVVVHSSEIKALRRAMKIQGWAVALLPEQTLGEVVTGKPASTEPERLPGEVPMFDDATTAPADEPGEAEEDATEAEAPAQQPTSRSRTNRRAKAAE